MTKVDIYSGFLGAGKTTLIRKLLKEAYAGKKTVIIENEFGEIGIDGGFLKDAGVEVREMNSGCICCSLTGDFKQALLMVLEEYAPERIVIEPSGVGKLSEVAAAVAAAGDGKLQLGGLTTVVDASKCRMYLKNFGEFFKDQVSSAHTIVLSRTGSASAEKVEEAVRLLRDINGEARIVTADWDELEGKDILALIDGRDTVSEELEALMQEHLGELGEEEHGHGHEHEHGGHCCGHEHEHEHGGHCCEHGHEHEHGEHCCGHEHHHEHGHHHHHGHGADEVFSSWGVHTDARFTKDQMEGILEALGDEKLYGTVLRAKGIVRDAAEGWIHFDYTPGEISVRKGPAAAAGMLCVIGAELKEVEVKRLFGEA